MFVLELFDLNAEALVERLAWQLYLFDVLIHRLYHISVCYLVLLHRCKMELYMHWWFDVVNDEKKKR